MIAVTIEGMSPALPQIVLQIWIWEISNGKTIANSFALIAHMNFSLENYSYELVNLTGTVGKVELIPTSITAVCESWNVSDKDTWDNVGDLKVGSHDPIFVQLSFRIFLCVTRNVGVHTIQFSHPIISCCTPEKHDNSCFENLGPFHCSYSATTE